MLIVFDYCCKNVREELLTQKCYTVIMNEQLDSLFL